MHSTEVQLKRATQNLKILADSFAESQRRMSSTSRAESASGSDAGRSESNQKRKRGRAAVVSWDLGHNPVGRAYVLYKLLEKDWDVDLVGPIWSRYGGDLWPPLKSAGMKIRGFKCKTIDDFVPKANLLAATKTYDVVYICKPRLPSVYIATLIKQNSECPIILDIDDFELSFFKNEEFASLDEISASADQALIEPYEELGTRYCQSLVNDFDAVTVSNIALREKFGGQIIRHARDEHVFKPSARNRAEGRRRLGIRDDEFALVFIGTPRPHKGVFDVAQALETLKDDNIVFHIVGEIRDPAVKARFNDYKHARVVFHGDCDFNDLHLLLSAADLVPLVQDPSHAISQYQIPAKISDATSLGIPIVATETPPVRDLALLNGIDIVKPEGLADRIRHYAAQGGGDSREIRSFFLNELSESVNATRLNTVIDQANDQFLPMTDNLTAMLNLFQQVYESRQSVKTPKPSAEVIDLVESAPRVSNDLPSQPVRNSGVIHKLADWGRRTGDRIIHPFGGSSGKFDIVFLWKQNDSGIYGRRSDMVLKYLSQSERVGKILQLDAPFAAYEIEQSFQRPLPMLGGHQDKVLQNLYDRKLNLKDSGNVLSRTYVTSRNDRVGAIAGQRIGKKEQYVDFVQKEMAAAGIDPANALLWVCPIVWDAPELIDELDFGGVVVDLIDDQRAWNSNPEFLEKLEESYRSTIEKADVLFTNCQPLVDQFGDIKGPINVIPNGAERLATMPVDGIPSELANLQKPLIGYVGNLRDRIDWQLLQRVVRGWPQASFVFIGPSSDSTNAMQLAENPNVHMLGVIPYNDVLAYLRAFDVAMVPHLRNKLTEHMNPLKLYNYYAAGLPIVSSDVSNIDDMRDSISIATTSTEFVAALKQAAERKPDVNSESWQGTMNKIAWDTRVSQMLDIIDSKFKRRLGKAA